MFFCLKEKTSDCCRYTNAEMMILMYFILLYRHHYAAKAAAAAQKLKVSYTYIHKNN